MEEKVTDVRCTELSTKNPHTKTTNKTKEHGSTLGEVPPISSSCTEKSTYLLHGPVHTSCIPSTGSCTIPACQHLLSSQCSEPCAASGYIPRFHLIKSSNAHLGSQHSLELMANRGPFVLMNTATPFSINLSCTQPCLIDDKVVRKDTDMHLPVCKACCWGTPPLCLPCTSEMLPD